jgi:hypothetical protein
MDIMHGSLHHGRAEIECKIMHNMEEQGNSVQYVKVGI